MLKKYSKFKGNIFFVLILIVGAFLRFYKISTNYYFSGELGKELLYIYQFASTHSLPLVGMATSHEWLSYGPIYYWIMIPIFNIFRGNPFILFWVAFVVSIAGLILNYIVVSKIDDKRLAIFSTLLEAISPLLIWQTRLSKLHVFFWLIMPILMYLMYCLWNGNRKWLFLSGILFGILFSFHFSQIPILGVFILLFWIKKKYFKFKDYLVFAAGVIIPNITLILRDKNLIVWLPYRVANIADKSLTGTIVALNEYLGKNIFWDNRLWFLGTLVFVTIFIHFTFKNREKIKTDFLTFYLVSSVSFMFIANVLHGSPPIHYFLPIFVTTPILFAKYLSEIKIWPLVVVILLIVNLISFNSEPLFYGDTKLTNHNSDMVPYSTLTNAASFIAKDAAKNSVYLKRVGPYDYFPENYSQNYKYLVIWKGGQINEDKRNVYTILETNGKVTIQK